MDWKWDSSTQIEELRSLKKKKIGVRKTGEERKDKRAIKSTDEQTKKGSSMESR